MVFVEYTILAILAIQDFKDRKVSAYLFVLLACLIAINTLWLHPGYLQWQSISVNLLLLLIMGLCLALYYLVRYKLKGLKNLSNSIGLADVLILLYFAIIMNSFYLMTFLVTCLLLSIVSVIILSSFLRIKTVPLVACLSLLYLINKMLIFSFKIDIIEQLTQNLWPM